MTGIRFNCRQQFGTEQRRNTFIVPSSTSFGLTSQPRAFDTAQSDLAKHKDSYRQASSSGFGNRLKIFDIFVCGGYSGVSCRRELGLWLDPGAAGWRINAMALTGAMGTAGSG